MDGDDVRCPDTGKVHPGFIALLNRLGVTYAEVSTSGKGAHALYEGQLPDGYRQAVFEIDTEPWGANDDPPTVEIYDGKHVCVITGEHIPGSADDIQPWNADALEAILEEHIDDADRHTDGHDTDRERPDMDGYEPTVTEADETTIEIRDVFAAIDRLQLIDLPLETRQVGTDGTGWEKWDPSTYRPSGGNDSLHTPDREAWYDQKTGHSFGLLALFAAEQDIISKPWHSLDGAKFWQAVERAREFGASIPVYEPPEDEERNDREPIAMLPTPARETSRARADANDWRRAAEQHIAADTDGRLTRGAVHDRVTGEITDALESDGATLIEALPTTGKSHGAIAAIAEADVPATIATGRGHKEQYEQLREWCDDHGLTAKILPSFTEDCDTANGEHGEEWQDRVLEWYHRGATAEGIHKSAGYELGEPLPCQRYEGQECPYTSQWRFDPEEYDVLIGHYLHLHVPKVTAGRAVVIDECPADAFERGIAGDTLTRVVNRYLERCDDVPFTGKTDLIEHRDDEHRRADAIASITDGDSGAVEPDPALAFADDGESHAIAPVIVATLLTGRELGNGWERAALGGGRVTVYNRADECVHVLSPPDFNTARTVVGLDGTPTRKIWELATGRHLDHQRVLSDDEREVYITDVMDLRYIRTSDYTKPYNSLESIDTVGDAALLEQIAEQHNTVPGLITTRVAKHEYKSMDGDTTALDHIAETHTKIYGNVLGSNELSDVRVGVVIGSNHYGDQFVQKWGAYAGQAIEQPDRSASENRGTGLSYGEFGDRILRHMREHDTLQAVMRFGRDGGGATVYAHTNTLPDWVPIAGEGRVIRTRSGGERQVIDAMGELGEASVSAIVDHPSVEIGTHRVREIVTDLEARSVLDCRQDPDDRRRWLYTDGGEFGDASRFGDVDLPEPTTGTDSFVDMS